MLPYTAKTLVAFTTDCEKLEIPAGAEVTVVEALPSEENPEAFVVEVAIPDETLVGDNRFDTAELKVSHLERVRQ